AFFLASAFVSSSFQLTISGSTGLGASGVAYAIFGFIWPLRHRFPQFHEALNQGTVRLFLMWLVGCMVATYLKIWEVGNAAHLWGLSFGGLAASFFVAEYRPRLSLAGLAGMVVLAVIPLFWCPWSAAWLGNKAYHAHADRRYQDALDLYTRVLQVEPENAWA